MHNDVSFDDIENGRRPGQSLSPRLEDLRGALLISLVAFGGVLTVIWIGFLASVAISELGFW